MVPVAGLTNLPAGMQVTMPQQHKCENVSVNNMRIYLFVILCGLSINPNAKGQDCNKAVAKKFVDGLFKEGQFVSYNSTHFKGYNKDLRFLRMPLLNKLLPDYCFYSTSFQSNYFEYRDVETALAISNDIIKKSLLIHSPVFTIESNDFISLFYGLEVDDTASTIKLAEEITSIFSAIVYRGHFNRVINLKDESAISFELWHNDLSWRIYDFYFDDRSKLAQIKINGGVKRGEMHKNYKRQ